MKERITQYQPSNYWEALLLTSPTQCMPKPNTKAYLLLKAIANKDRHSRDELQQLVGGALRGHLQWLAKHRWLIHTYEPQKGFQAEYWLDERHMSECWEADDQARREARLRYAKRSLDKAAEGIERHEKAREEYQQALDEFYGIDSRD